jgi:diguanylate cyclase (GGDEF)-like protein
VPRPRFSVIGRFAVVLLVLVPSLLALAWKGSDSLSSSRRLTDTLFNDIIVTQHASADMVTAMDDVHATALSALALRASDPARSRTLTARISDILLPKADEDLATVERLHQGDDADELRTIGTLQARWSETRSLWNSLALDPNVATNTGIAQLDQKFAELNQISRALVARETVDGHAEYVDSAQPFASSRRTLLFILALALAAGIASVLWLYRGVLPRTRKYAAFASRLADGKFEGHLESTGKDELAVLGRTLDDMATRRQRERDYDLSQLQFAESMQFAEDEPEAHRTLKRHLELSIADSDVVVLNRNNSENRLEAVTEIRPDSPLEISLDGASPRACIAVRQARTHEHAHGDDALLECSVCGACPGITTCTPFLVGGEVIGSVLIEHPQSLDDEAARRIRDSVVQASPVLANLRNLALAETRAATDSLTGLPNRRSVDANVMRMVAHAGRSMEPIAVLLLDLDHFKQVNDRYGHAGGDEVLAAVGAALRASIRDSDFAGRYGGEEFIVVLPNTSVEGAVRVAEVLRGAIGEIKVASVDQRIGVSVGVAALPEHAADTAGLVRSADRALYSAKSNGRDRVETARTNGSHGVEIEHRNGEVVTGP